MYSVRQVCIFYGELGGVERAVMDLVSGLKERYLVDVLCTKHGRGVQIEQIEGVQVTRAGGPVALAGRPVSRSFLHHLCGTQADIVHYHLPCPLATLGHLLNRPKARISLATWHHDLQRYPAVNNVQLVVLWKLFKELDSIIVTSPAMLDSVRILSEYRDKCHVIPYGVNEARFENISEEAVELIRKKFGRPLVLFVGRLVYYKGCDVLIRAMAAVDASLLIVGTGPLEVELKSLVGELGLSNRIHFLGRLPDSELGAVYRACDLFVLPSTQSTECFGLVQVEAMLAGLPVVNTNLPTGVPWVSPDQLTGLTVPPGDIQALTDAIVRLLSDSELSRRFGVAGRQRALENYTLRSQVEAICHLYNDLLTRK